MAAPGDQTPMAAGSRVGVASPVAKLALALPLAVALGCAPPAARPAPAAAARKAASSGARAEAVADAPWRRAAGKRAPAASKAAPVVLIRGARLLVGDGSEIARGHVLLRGGRIAEVGPGAGQAPAGAVIVGAKGKTVTPGLIDVHSHLGVYPTPFVNAHRDGNEVSGPVTAAARAVDAFWPQDPGLQRALAGGVTTLQVVPGSANLIGGLGLTIKLRRATTSRAMQMRGAPSGLKMACGENPKRVYGERDQAPSTRMGNLALQRKALLEARRLIAEWDAWRLSERQRRAKHAREQERFAARQRLRQQRRRQCAAGQQPARRCYDWRQKWREQPLAAPEPLEPKLPPARNPALEHLAAALEGRVLVHVHCYRADDMADMMALGDEVGLRIRAFHHALEAYKIRDLLARRHIATATWADWWGFKMEAYDGIPENLALVDAAGGRAIVHSDSREGIRRLNQEAAKGMAAGRQAGLKISEAEAIRWITLNPAWALGIDERTGSLTVGKDADVVIWDRNPSSVYASAERVYVDGVLRYDRRKPTKRWSDFEASP